MQILLTNDDGFFEPGLAAMYAELIKIGEVRVVAPVESRSGAGHCISLGPMACTKAKIENKFTGYSVHGTPADCVKLAILQLYPKRFDLVVSGINSGSNVGINVYYSGTVAAALEAGFLGVGAIAVNLAMDKTMHYELAAKLCTRIIRKLMPIQADDVININIPMLSQGEPRGICAVPQSTVALSEQFIPLDKSDGKQWFQLSSISRNRKTSPDLLTDADLLGAGYITITALSGDMTNHPRTSSLANIDWR